MAISSLSCTTYIPYSRKFWREEYLADCSNNGIWRILLWRLGKLYTIIIFKMVTYVTDRNGSSVNTAESVSNLSTSNEAGTS